MGYRCPVCSDPQSDREHLANHLAFTAMLREDGHESYLDERVPDWEELTPGELAEQVVDDAEEADFPQVFEDTTDADGHGHHHESGRSGHDHGAGRGGHDRPGQDGGDPLVDPTGLDEESRAVFREAREMTRRRDSEADADGTETHPNACGENDRGSDRVDGVDSDADGGSDVSGSEEADAAGRDGTDASEETETE